MSLPIRIIDGCATGRGARVTPSGELVVGPHSYSETIFQSMTAADTAYEFYAPLPGEQFVITGIRVKATTGVHATNDATIIIYEGDSSTTLTVDKTLHQEAMVKGENATLLPLQILVRPGKHVLGKTDDAIVFMTVMGYFIDELP